MRKVLVIILFFIFYLSGNSQTIYINKYLKDSVFSGSNRGLFFDSTHNGNWQPLATRVYAQNNGGGGGGGSGTVTSVSGLSPLFTTANPTTTPTFSLSNTSQYNVFGRSASGSGAPSYVSIDTTFISNFYLKTRGLISLTTTGTSGAATYNNVTGVLNIPQYSGGNSIREEFTNSVSTSITLSNTPRASTSEMYYADGVLIASGNVSRVGTTVTFSGFTRYINTVITAQYSY